MAGDRVSLPHVRALDGLRGIAIVGVVLYHGDRLRGGYLGVDLFFVLSGYLITSLLLAELHNNGRVSLGFFWARRARRLLPALVPLLCGVALYCVVLAEPNELGRIRGDALATMGYFANWRAIFAGHGYFDLFAASSPLEHTWSLAIEEQFYFVWPLLFIGIATWSKHRTAQAVFVVGAVLGAASAALMIVGYEASRVDRLYYGTDTRAFALFAGIALAAIMLRCGSAAGGRFRIAIEVAALASLAALGGMWVAVDGREPGLYRGGFAFAGVAAALLVTAAVQTRRGPVAAVLSFPPFCWLGVISYGLYLWHWPVDVVLSPSRVGLDGWSLFAVRTAVAIAIAIGSYHFVEMPIRRGALRRAQWQILFPTITVALVATIFVVTAGATTPGNRANRTGRAEILIAGDSVANSLIPGLVTLGFSLRDATINGCRLVNGKPRSLVSATPCPWRTEWANARGSAEPRVVVLVQGAFDLYDVRLPHSRKWLVPGSPGWATAYQSALEDAIDILARDGATIVLPTIPCMQPNRQGSPLVMLLTPEPFRVTAANRVIRQIARRDERVVSPDLFDRLCPTGGYQTNLGGVSSVRPDGVHFGEAGAELVARFLRPSLAHRP